MKRFLKGFLIWFVSTAVLVRIFSQLFPSGTKTPLFLSFFVLIAPVYCAVRFSKSKEQGKSNKKQMISTKPTTSHSTSMARIDNMEGHAFESFVADLLRKLGYERVKVTPGSGDQGVDVIAVKDGKKYAIQCKRYSKKLGNKPVQEVNAGRTIYGCNVAVVITNNYFTDGGKEAAKALGVELWDRDALRKMITYADFKAGRN